MHRLGSVRRPPVPANAARPCLAAPGISGRLGRLSACRDPCLAKGVALKGENVFGVKLMLPMAALTAALALWGCQGPVGGTMTKVFAEAAFDAGPGHDLYSMPNLRRDELWKWDRPIALRLAGNFPAEHEEMVHAELRRFGTLTSVQIGDAGGGRANFTVALFNTEAVRIGNKWVPCATSFADSDGTTVNVRVLLAKAAPAKVRRCLRHELMHAFGFLGHSHRVRSILSYVHGEEDLTRWDEVLLKSLYDSRLTTGMPRSEVMAVLDEVIEENM